MPDKELRPGWWPGGCKPTSSVPGRFALRIFVASLLLTLTASFADRPDPPGLVVATKSDQRITRRFAVGLEYLVIEPRTVEPDAELPMIVWIHGRGGAPEPPPHAFLDLQTPVRVIMPRGPLRYGQGYAWMPVSAHHGDSAALNGPLRERVRELDRALDVWQDRHPTVGQPIVTGFSQGGILTATLAVTHPEAIRWAFPMAGWIPEAIVPRTYDASLPPVRIHALHGSHDPIIGTERTRRQLGRLRELGYPVVFESVASEEHAITPHMLVRLRQLIERAIRDMPEHSTAAGLS